MNAGPDVERRISDYLAEQTPTRAPDRILPATFDRTRRTRQRRFGAAWRSITMNRTWQLATAAVVGILIIGLGAVWLGGTGGSGGPSPTPSPPLHRVPRRRRTRRPARRAGELRDADARRPGDDVTIPAGWGLAAPETRQERRHRPRAGR